MEHTNEASGLAKAFYNAVHSVGNVGSRLRSAYDIATGHSQLEKMGLAKSDSARGGLNAVGGVVASISGFAVGLGIAVSAWPLALLAIPPALFVGLAILPQQAHSLYKTGQAGAVEAGIEQQPILQESQEPESGFKSPIRIP